MVALASAANAHVQEAPIRIQGDNLPSSDLSKCPTDLKKNLAALPRKVRRGLKFHCENGRLYVIFSAPDNPIADDWVSFCANNTELLGLKSEEVRVVSDKGPRKLVQHWRGFDLFEPCLGQQIIHPTLGRYFRLTIRAIDTSHWIMPSAPSISSSTAINLAVSDWKGEQYDPDPTDIHVELQLLPNNPQPQLIWKVTSHSEMWPLECLLNVQTGEEIGPLACSENQPM